MDVGTVELSTRLFGLTVTIGVSISPIRCANGKRKRVGWWDPANFVLAAGFRTYVTVSVPLTGGACLTIGRHGERCEQNSVSAIKNPALIITWVTYSNPAMCVANASMPNHPVSR